VEVGSVKWSVYGDYIRALGVTLLIGTLISYFLSHSFNAGTSIWLSAWSDDSLNETTRTDTGLRNLRLTGYAVFGLGEAVFVLAATLTLNLACLAAAQLLHRQMLTGVLDAPVRFFDCTPLGRILNRFSKDIDTADFGICINVRGVLVYTFRALVSFLLISLETPLFLFALLPLGIFYWTLQKVYIAASRQLKRIESTSRSPVYSHFQETVSGASSIRAYASSVRFERECCARLDKNHQAYFPSFAALRWLTVRLELLGYTIVCLAALLAVFQRHELTAGLAGVSISSALTITATLNMLVRSCSDLETNIVAIERCLEYTRLESESPTRAQSPPTTPPPDWPSQGNIRFETYSTKYRTDLPDVLHDLTFEVRAGEKIGIVGRTGAGKSSLTLALFRVLEASSGRICIDDLPINRLALVDLRSRLSIIPQEPILFAGSLRSNLDPHNQLSDDQLWRALEQAHLRDFVASCTDGLEFTIGEGGDNLSVGQRQLLCLARAVLRQSKILVLDEATAAVDVETDELIQRTIRREFSSCTIMTIAHRLHTILDYDRVLVLQHGRLAEYNSPRTLLQDANSLFYSMARDAKII
jgi:ABC-type multidrug transport system fused ATPase/permease subunit